MYQNNTSGIGGCNLSASQDLIVAYDFEHSRKKDYLICYRPGAAKVVWIIKHTSSNTFIPVFQSTNGIGGFNLDQPQERIFTFDYDHSGKEDHQV